MTLDWLRMEDAFEQLRFNQREREAGRLFVAGLSNNEIANTMFIEVKTVRGMICEMRRKAGIMACGRQHRVCLLRALYGLAVSGPCATCAPDRRRPC